ncbi:MAG: type II toxin-antitoxin system HipA family toxin [Gemmatimonadales bacterium]|nr:MAG: type II toxin-antitoxin system HipA family toxin [Gemmatimonadales bacterium]
MAGREGPEPDTPHRRAPAEGLRTTGRPLGSRSRGSAQPPPGAQGEIFIQGDIVMSSFSCLAEVHLYGELVGAVGETSAGEVVFEFDSTYQTSGLDLSPLQLPLRRRTHTFPELRGLENFKGLPGVLADALPDAFGRSVLRAFHTSRGVMERELSPVQSLLYVGRRAIGALEFEPADEPQSRLQEREALDIATLVEGARKAISGEVDGTLSDIYRVGSSAGGARPKAVVLWNREENEIRSPFHGMQGGDIHAILKFDGVGDDATPDRLGKPLPFNRMEAAYSLMARSGGLDAVEVVPHDSGQGLCHLFIPRFDRVTHKTRDGSVSAQKIHQHTFGGLVHVDYNTPGASSYEEFFRTTQRLGMGSGSVDEAYRRAIFNILAVNQDDHVKNLSFQLPPSGKWQLAPAYDLTFAKGSGFTSAHQMRFADKVSGFTRDDLIGVGREYGVRDPAGVIEKIHDAILHLPEFAAETRVDETFLAVVIEHVNQRLQSLGLSPIPRP